MNTNSVNSWRCGVQRFDFSQHPAPLVMGVVNVTPDSFSDGGSYESCEQAVAHGISLWEAGADILDIGGESTRPGATPVSLEEEKRRVLPVVESLVAKGCVVSVDTMKPQLMRDALNCGAHIINDVCGFASDESIAAVAESNCGVVCMHMQGQAQTMQDNPHYDDVVSDVKTFLQTQARRLVAAGVDSERICLDPGIGFGKTLSHNQQLLAALMRGERFCDDANYPLLIGVSRKSLFKNIMGDAPAAARDGASATAAALLAMHGANILRVHNVTMTKQALATAQLFANNNAGESQTHAAAS